VIGKDGMAETDAGRGGQQGGCGETHNHIFAQVKMRK
jgi:hypothetical protein